MSPNEFCTESLCEGNSVHFTSHPCLQTLWGRELSPTEFSVCLELGQSLCSRAAFSWFSLLLPSDRTLSTQCTVSTEVQDEWLAGRCGSDPTVFAKQLPLGWIKDQPFSILSRESRIFIFPPWVNTGSSLVGRHNG